MIEQYFGIKELYEIVLRAKNPMQFGERFLEKDEPVLYFEKISFANIVEDNRPIIARGGWANLPRVIWEDRSEVRFSVIEGVLSSISMGILLGSRVIASKKDKPILVHKREGPKRLVGDHFFHLDHWPVNSDRKKTFIFNYERNAIQEKIYGKRIYTQINPLDSSETIPTLQLYNDKELTELASMKKNYIVDYYYEYNDEALLYTIQKERFNGLFTLEGKFYSKDENEGQNYTNIIYMPKVRVVSNIDLRLGERADPAVGNFEIIALPENTVDYQNLIMDIQKLNDDIDNI